MTKWWLFRNPCSCLPFKQFYLCFLLELLILVLKLLKSLIHLKVIHLLLNVRNTGVVLFFFWWVSSTPWTTCWEVWVLFVCFTLLCFCLIVFVVVVTTHVINKDSIAIVLWIKSWCPNPFPLVYWSDLVSIVLNKVFWFLKLYSFCLEWFWHSKVSCKILQFVSLVMGRKSLGFWWDSLEPVGCIHGTNSDKSQSRRSWFLFVFIF